MTNNDDNTTNCCVQNFLCCIKSRTKDNRTNKNNTEPDNANPSRKNKNSSSSSIYSDANSNLDVVDYPVQSLTIDHSGNGYGHDGDPGLRISNVTLPNLGTNILFQGDLPMGSSTNDNNSKTYKTFSGVGAGANISDRNRRDESKVNADKDDNENGNGNRSGGIDVDDGVDVDVDVAVDDSTDEEDEIKKSNSFLLFWNVNKGNENGNNNKNNEVNNQEINRNHNNNFLFWNLKKGMEDEAGGDGKNKHDDNNGIKDVGIVAEEEKMPEDNKIVEIRIDTQVNDMSLRSSSSSKMQEQAPVSPMPSPTITESGPGSKKAKKKKKKKKANPRLSPKLSTENIYTDVKKDLSGDKEDLVQNELLQKLAKEVPEATAAERKRFLVARKNDYSGALDQLTTYITWRKECRLDDDHTGRVSPVPTNIPSPFSFNGDYFDDDGGFLSCASSVGAQDRADWDSAAQAAIMYTNDLKEREAMNSSNRSNSNRQDDARDSIKIENAFKKKDKMLPQLAHMVTEIGSTTYLKDKQGNRILQLLPAQIDMKEADEMTYALAIAFYLDKKLGRNSAEKIVVSVDVRAGGGWANPPAKKIVPFIKAVIALLERNFPERLSKCILYPLPRAATVLWKMIKIFLDPTTAEKIVVIGGGAGIDDKVSSQKFEKIVESHVHKRMEEIRRESFVLPSIV